MWLGRLLALVLLLPLLSSHAAAPSGIAPAKVLIGYVRGLPGRSPTTSAYLLLENTGRAPLRLVGASSPRAGAIEIHKHFQRDGQARMRRLPHVDIAPGNRVAFAPGGLHLMLFRLTSVPRDGEAIPIELRFSGGLSLPITLPVCSVMRDSCPSITADTPRRP